MLGCDRMAPLNTCCNMLIKGLLLPASALVAAVAFAVPAFEAALVVVVEVVAGERFNWCSRKMLFFAFVENGSLLLFFLIATLTGLRLTLSVRRGCLRRARRLGGRHAAAARARIGCARRSAVHVMRVTG